MGLSMRKEPFLPDDVCRDKVFPSQIVSGPEITGVPVEDLSELRMYR